jgi:flagellar hook assembly protein FlgD
MVAGKHSIPWNARNENNSQVDPGIYVCRMLVGNQTETSKQMLVVN